MELKAYRVTGIDIEHDGERHVIGSRIDLDDKTASTLSRWLAPWEAESPKQPSDSQHETVVVDPSEVSNLPDDMANEADDSADDNANNKTGDDSKPANTKGQRNGQGAKS